MLTLSIYRAEDDGYKNIHMDAYTLILVLLKNLTWPQICICFFISFSKRDYNIDLQKERIVTCDSMNTLVSQSSL